MAQQSETRSRAEREKTRAQAVPVGVARGRETR